MNDQPTFELAVIDRYEGRLAVLLVGAEQRVLDVPRRALPRGARPGTWLRITLDGERLIRAEIDAEATAAAQARIAEKLARLRRSSRYREPAHHRPSAPHRYHAFHVANM